MKLIDFINTISYLSDVKIDLRRGNEHVTYTYFEMYTRHDFINRYRDCNILMIKAIDVNKFEIVVNMGDLK